ncbi:hypothetical protein PIB30_048854 [Stylosanthes scabra]|uniref:Uncharacterized protein n=1 Tax=Stylosanthes scabra TaxID=79078 RepID=A0ABU6WIU8_9FABA|nr:hypothetical protein [Stylosanthes scabra]
MVWKEWRKHAKEEISQRSKNEKRRKGNRSKLHGSNAIGKITSRASKQYIYVIYVRPHRVPCGRIYWSDVQGTGIPRSLMVTLTALKNEGQNGNFESRAKA